MKTLVFASVMEMIYAFGASSWASGPLAKAAGTASASEDFRPIGANIRSSQYERRIALGYR